MSAGSSGLGRGRGRALAPAVEAGARDLSLFLALRAFASGCAALTGIEAVSDGVPAFRSPESAQCPGPCCSGWASSWSSCSSASRSWPTPSRIVPVEGETVTSQLARRVFGHGVLYYAVQAVTTLILLLAANTSFADFPRLAFFLARDRFLPRQFANRGDRLAFSNGIIILAVLSALLLVVFRGTRTP